MTTRRSFLRGIGATLIAAPAIARFASLMPVKPLPWMPLRCDCADPPVCGPFLRFVGGSVGWKEVYVPLGLELGPEITATEVLARQAEMTRQLEVFHRAFDREFTRLAEQHLLLGAPPSRA